MTLEDLIAAVTTTDGYALRLEVESTPPSVTIIVRRPGLATGFCSHETLQEAVDDMADWAERVGLLPAGSLQA